MRQTAHHHAASQGRPGGTRAAFPGKCLSLTSFRRECSGVATPVWFVEADGRLRGSPVPAWAELLPDAEVARVDQLMGRKYRIDLLFIKPIRTLQAALQPRRPRGTPVVLEITPS